MDELILKDLKEWIEGLPKDKVFSYGLSSPFSWRGSYNEVAFSIDRRDTTRKELLDSIWQAYNLTFMGWKGDEYRYDDHTPVHFEEEFGSYSEGKYCAEKIADIKGGEIFYSQEERLIKKVFS